MGQCDSLYKSLLQRIEDDRTEDNLTFPFGSEILTIASGQTDSSSVLKLFNHISF